MKITFSIPAECTIDAQKKLLDALRKELLDLAFVELKNELLILELAPCADPIDATDPTNDVTDAVTDETQSEQSSSEKPDASAGGCNSSLLPVGAVTIVLMLAAIPTFIKKKREE